MSIEAKMTWKVALHLWWRLLWRSMLLAFTLSFIVGFSIGFVRSLLAHMAGEKPTEPDAVLMVLLGLFIGCVVQLCVFKHILSKKNRVGAYRLVLIEDVSTDSQVHSS